MKKLIVEGLLLLMAALFPLSASTAWGADICWTDLDGDGKVFPSDAMVLLNEWKRKDCSVENTCQADIDGDGKVFPSDAMIFLMEWKSKNCPDLP